MSQPEKVFRIGSCFASVFANTDSQDRSYRTVVLQRRYRDERGEWRGSSSYTLSQLPGAIKALGMACDYVAYQEAEMGDGGEDF